jgi:F0F1-type ATP synthase membrane subunit c/vacuolar-type H+-ATPase subunit K
MLAVGGHGWAIAAGCRILARSPEASSLAESFVIILYAMAPPLT